MTAGQPIMGHLAELRRRLFIVAVTVVVASIAAFIFRNWIFDVFARPFERVVGEGKLVYFRPTEGFSFFMRLSLFGGFVLSSPVVLWQLWAFVAPALTKREKRYAIPVVAALVLLFLSGLAFAYWSLERALSFLFEFGGESLSPQIGAAFYLTFAIRFLLVFAFAFEFPVFLFLAAAAGAITSRRLAAGRRWAVLIIVIVGAVITPSGDPLTLLLLSGPLYLLYEMTIWLIRWILKK